MPFKELTFSFDQFNDPERPQHIHRSRIAEWIPDVATTRGEHHLQGFGAYKVGQDSIPYVMSDADYAPREDQQTPAIFVEIQGSYPSRKSAPDGATQPVLD